MAWTENIQPTISILVERTSNQKTISFRILFQEHVDFVWVNQNNLLRIIVATYLYSNEQRWQQRWK